jgi:membrane protein YdbS with pleckstrin-like domain
VQPQQYEDEASPPADASAEGAMTALDPRQIWVLTIRAGLFGLLLVVIALVADFGPLRDTPIPAWYLTGAVTAAALVGTLVFPRRRYRRWGYREGEDELQIRRGMLVRVRTVVPFGRVQHIDVAQGPIQRAFGLATIILHTAGTAGAAVPLPGIRQAEAEAMRDRIRAKIRQDLM